MEHAFGPGRLETKFCTFGEDIRLGKGAVIEGYASVFGVPDRGGDIVQKGAYAASLAARPCAVKLLWQHDPAQPIGVWDEIAEDDHGLRVKGRLLTDLRQGAEALALLRAGAIDGLSIGYRTKKAMPDGKGRRKLAEVELWEVSLVTFPMLPEARVLPEAEDAKAAAGPQSDIAMELAEVLAGARQSLTQTP